jgi:hypothetical protein
LKPALVVGVLIFIALNKYVITAMAFMLGQASGGMQSSDMSSVLFPYFLVPSGIAAFWGLFPIAGVIGLHEPFISLSIAGGLILFYWLGRYVMPKQIKRDEAPASVLLVMLFMGLLLFHRNNDFGLFKLAMFAQPFLMGVVAIELGGIIWSHASRYVKISLPAILMANVISQYVYVGKSTGEQFGGLNEIPHASAMKVNQQFEDLLNSDLLKQESLKAIVLETSSINLAKFQALYTNGKNTFFISRPFFRGIYNGWIGVDSDISKLAKSADQYQTRTFGDNQFDSFELDLLENNRSVYIYSSIQSDIFNVYSRAETKGKYFIIDNNLINRLQFIHSSLGNHYYLGERKVAAFFQLEDDPMFPEQKFASLGRQLLLRAIHPSDQPRLVMEFTSTVAQQYASELPQPSVEKTQLNFVGRGSGRVFSEPLRLSMIDNASYVSIDMGREAKQFPSNVKGLMLLYGLAVPADQRRITAFGRDISLISDEQYQSLRPPVSLKNFPADLADKNLEYSGIYEDGWISERSFFVLSAQQVSKFLVVKGIVPQIKDPNFSSALSVSLNGKLIAQPKVGLGNFEVKVPVSALQSRQRVDLVFTNYQQLPGADGRITGGKIDFIGFTEN